MKTKILLITLLTLAFVTHAPTIAQDNDNTSQIYELSWSNDGLFLAIGYEDGTVEILNVLTETIIEKWQAHEHGVLIISWRSDGLSLATSGFDRDVKIWNTESARLEIDLPSLENSIVYDIGWSPNNKYLVIVQEGGNSNLSVWDFDQNQYVLEESIPTATEILWNPNHDMLAISYFWPTIDLRDASTFTTLSYIGTNPANFDTATGSSITGMDWSSDGSLLVSAGLGGYVTLWDVVANVSIYDSLLAFGQAEDVSQLLIKDIWFAKSDYVFSSISSDGTFRTWLTETGENILDFNLGSSAVQAEVSPDKTKLAYVDENNELHIVAINDLITEQIRLKIDECSPPETLSTTLNTYLDNSDGLGFVGELATLDENALSADCVAQLTAMANLLVEDDSAN